MACAVTKLKTVELYQNIQGYDEFLLFGTVTEPMNNHHSHLILLA
jgi:hypothetical protein